VSSVGYFLYVNGIKEGCFYEHGEGRMRFDTTVIAYEGGDEWVDECVSQAVSCFDGDEVPDAGASCDTCGYLASRAEINL